MPAARTMTPRSSSSASSGRPPRRPLRLLARHPAPRPVAGRAEGLLVSAGGADEDERVAPHVPGDDHRLADATVALGDLRMTRRVGARRALAVHADPQPLAAALEGLELGDVVADVVDHLEAAVARPAVESVEEALARPVAHHLPVGEGEVCG